MDKPVIDVEFKDVKRDGPEPVPEKIFSETRQLKIHYSKSGGNASASAMAGSIKIPTKFLKELGITPEERDIWMTCTGGYVIIQKALKSEEVKE